MDSNSKKYYNKTAVTLATFLGGPLAAGILLRRNYINNGKKEQGNIALYLSLLLSIILIVITYQITDEHLEKLSNFIIPAISVSLVIAFFDKLQGKIISYHKENNGLFYSRWRVAGNALLSMAILMTGIIGYEILLGEENFFKLNKEQKLNNNMAVYEERMSSFANMEMMALDVLRMPGGTPKEEMLSALKDRGIYYWNENIILLNELNRMELPDDVKNVNKKLRKYCELRIKSYELIHRSVMEETQAYSNEIEIYHSQIEKLLKELSERNMNL